jgi:hypothetical protein
VPNYEEDLGDTFAEVTAYLITAADRAIDHELNVPEGFFVAGGVTVTAENHSGADLGYAQSWYENPYSSGWQPHLTFNYKPVIGVTTVKEFVNGAYVTRTVNVDYIITATGVRYIKNIPAYSFDNIQVTYVAGYAATPAQVTNVSAQLTAAMINAVVINKDYPGTSVNLGPAGASRTATPGVLSSLTDSCFSDSLKAELEQFRNVTAPRVV